MALDNMITGRESNFNEINDRPNFQLVRADVSDMPDLGEAFDLICHMACPASPLDYQKYPVETMRAESVGTFATLELARQSGAKYLLTSTSEVYGDPEVSPQPESYWGRVNPIGPRSCYDESKRFAEALSMSYLQMYGVDIRIARIFNSYGPNMRVGDGRVVPNFISQALTGDPLTVFGDGRQTRSLCYVSDTIEGLFLLASAEGLNERVINIGNPNEMTMLELAQRIKDLCGSDSQLEFRPLPTDDPKRRCPDIQRAQQYLGWQPKISITQGLAKTIDHFKEVLDAPTAGVGSPRRGES